MSESTGIDKKHPFERHTSDIILFRQKQLIVGIFNRKKTNNEQEVRYMITVPFSDVGLIQVVFDVEHAKDSVHSLFGNVILFKQASFNFAFGFFTSSMIHFEELLLLV